MSEPRILQGPKLDPKCESHQSFHCFIIENARKYSERIFVIEHFTGKCFTYENFLDDVLRLSNSLKINGFTAGQVFLVYGYNSYEYLVSYLAGLLVGGIAVGVRGEDTAYELIREINVRGAKWIFIQEELLTLELIKETAGLKVFTFDTNESKSDNTWNVSNIWTLIQNNLRLKDEDIFKPQNTREAPCTILESSGTTGPAKGAILSHYSLRMLFSGLIKFTEIEPNDVVIHSSPLAHLSGFLFAAPTKSGAKIVLVRESSPEFLAGVIEKYKVTKAILSPSNINVLSNPGFNFNFSSLRRVLTGGAKVVPLSVMKFIKQYQPDEFINCYGMSETCGMISEMDLCQAQKLGINLNCVGKPVAGIQIKVIDVKSGHLLGPHQSGELCIKTPFRFLKYHNDPERTKATLDEEGWIHSGDVGLYDEDGYIYLIDRIKDMIVQNGFHFSTADIEEVLLKHPDVVDACAVGIPKSNDDNNNNNDNDLAHAFVIIKSGSATTENELKSFVNGQVSKLKQIKGDVHFVSEFPKTSFGKVKRRELRDLFLSKT